MIKLPAAYDISRYEVVPDFTALNPRPKLIITKATEGTGWTDPTFADYFPAIKAGGIARGAYHFHRKAYPPATQAAHFINIVQSAGIAPGDFVILDVEEGGESASMLRTWCETVMAALPQCKLMIYSRKNLLDPIAFLLPNMFKPTFSITMSETDREFFTQIPVWTAGYPANPDDFDSVPAGYIPDQTKWGPVWLWQYSDKGIVEGIEGGVDLNWMSPEILAYIGEPTQPPQESNEMYNFVSTTNQMSLRNGPSIQDEKIQSYAPGTIFAGDFLQFYPVPARDAFIGDFWLHVTEVAGVAVDGWVAVVHQGVKYGDVTVVNGNPTKIFPDVITAKIDDETQDYEIRA